MRAPASAVAILLEFATAVGAEEAIRPENRAIANASYVLLQSNEYSSRKLEILTPDKAVFYGGSDAPVLVARVAKCTYAIKSRGITGYRIDFSRLYGSYYFDNSSGRLQMIFPGEGAVACYLNEEKNDMCYQQAVFYRAPSLQTPKFIASISYIMDNGCPAAVPAQPKPRF